MIYDNVKQLASEKGMSIHALEQKAGLGNGAIGRWREFNPGVLYLKKVADVLDVTVDELLKGVKT